ncbi:MAG: 2,3-bisphosphoglycerate-independent phosphoglycerate mutase [Desulfurococcales archaeon]|nr:2,3-bisphosphoglycerate-independent phosphoglycerate mutase [Desulfurococcales archaeon]
MRLLFVVLDGAPDGFGVRSSLEVAFKPFIDGLAGRGVCGVAYTVGRGVAPESDVAVMSLLGYDPGVYYTGRGPLEALGAGVEFRDGDVALRANFATVDPGSLRIIDRRAGRSLSSREARILAEALDGMLLDGGRGVARFRATIGHRGVLVLRHRDVRLEADISNTDPAYERVGRISHARRSYEPFIMKAVPLKDSPGARKAAEMVNEFTFKAIEILDRHPVNEERRRKGLLPANAVLLRDAGDSLPHAEPFRERFGFTMASIVEMVVERGIAKALGLVDVKVDVEGVPKEEVLRREAETAASLLNRYGGVYVHLKGPDEPGHDGDFEGKVRAIEMIDKYFFAALLDLIDPSNTVILLTSDHSTPWHLKAHSDDPVPLLVSHPSLPEGPGRFHEKACAEHNTLGTIERGHQILPTVLDYLKSRGLEIRDP